MKIAEILSVGDELLSGSVVDTNAAWLSRALAEAGYPVRYRQTCPDEFDHLESALRLALSRSSLVVLTGGLGPTFDDITRDVAAKVFDMPLELDEGIAKDLTAYFHQRRVTMSDNNLRQAQVPRGATVLKNDWGTAPGLFLESSAGRAILLPGVPFEMKKLFEMRVRPLLGGDDEGQHTEVLHFFGLSESGLAKELESLLPETDPFVATYANQGVVEVHVTSHDASAKEKCRKAKKKILSALGEHVYGTGKTSLEREVVNLYREKGITLATAESCTGGLLSQRITSVPGASHIFSLGVSAYSEEIKKSVLGVEEETLQTHGVYSARCALEMARGVRILSGADVGIGITGIAGPEGGKEKDPVGTVYIALVSPEGEEWVREGFYFKSPDRDRIRLFAANKALWMALFYGKKKK